MQNIETSVTSMQKVSNHRYLDRWLFGLLGLTAKEALKVHSIGPSWGECFFQKRSVMQKVCPCRDVIISIDISCGLWGLYWDNMEEKWHQNALWKQNGNFTIHILSYHMNAYIITKWFNDTPNSPRYPRLRLRIMMANSQPFVLVPEKAVARDQWITSRIANQADILTTT